MSFEAELRCRELLVHVGDRDQVGAAAARVEIEAMVEELAEGHQEQVGPIRVRRADRVPVRIERLLADHVADKPRIGKGRDAVGRGRADRVGARLRCCLRLVIGRGKTKEWLVSGSPIVAAGREIVVEAADVANERIWTAHQCVEEIEIAVAELDR